MKQTRVFAKATVTAKAERSIEIGHPWVYDTEVVSAENGVENGGLVDVVSIKGKYLGTGFLSERSKIRIRLVSRNANDRFDRAFWERRLRHAWEYRKTVMGGDLGCCRLIFGEADFFPGLTVDRFSDVSAGTVILGTFAFFCFGSGFIRREKSGSGDSGSLRHSGTWSQARLSFSFLLSGWRV